MHEGAEHPALTEKTMDAQRFGTLASIYGGRLQSWPEEERSTAEAFALSADGRAILARADALDAMLDAYAVPAPSSGLHARILQDGRARLASRRRGRLWWSGFGLAGLGLAGVLAGALLVAVISPPPLTDHTVFDADTTAFGDLVPSQSAQEDM